MAQYVRGRDSISVNSRSHSNVDFFRLSTHSSVLAGERSTIYPRRTTSQIPHVFNQRPAPADKKNDDDIEQLFNTQRFSFFLFLRSDCFFCPRFIRRALGSETKNAGLSSHFRFFSRNAVFHSLCLCALSQPFVCVCVFVVCERECFLAHDVVRHRFLYSGQVPFVRATLLHDAQRRASCTLPISYYEVLIV